MTKAEFTEGLKSNWYLAVIMLACFGIAGFMAAQGGDGAKAEATSNLAARPEHSFGGATGQQAVAYSDPARMWKRPDVEKRAENDLERYQEVLTNNPTPDEAALAVVRSANVYYTKLRDYDQAASLYERLLSDYPDYQKNLHGVYSNLGACYEKLGNRAMARSTYERMKAHFGPGTHEYSFASEQLRRI